MKRILISLLIFSCLVSCAQVDLEKQVSKRKAGKWRNDLVTLHEEMIQRHVDIYRIISKESLDSAVNLLYEDIPQLSPSQILVRISQLMAMIGDGHTSFFPGDQKRKKFRLYPMKFWAFSEGIFVTSTTEEYRHFLGKKLIKIESTPVSEITEKISSTIGADNDMEYTYNVPFGIAYAELIHVLGITASADRGEFHFENGHVTLYSSSLKEWLGATYICANKVFPNGRSPSQRVEALFATPLTVDSLKFKGRRMFYWYKHLEEPNAMFLQYNVCWDQKDRPRFADMVRQMCNEIDQSGVERLIIDLRQNSGGEPIIIQPLLDELQQRKTYVEEGRVFVLVGRRTFSAALTNAAQLRKMGARIVGEAPRGKPNNPSEGRDINLRATRIWATVATQYVERDPDLGDLEYLPVDIQCEMTFDDFQNGRDLALDMALSAGLFD